MTGTKNVNFNFEDHAIKGQKRHRLNHDAVWTISTNN